MRYYEILKALDSNQLPSNLFDIEAAKHDDDFKEVYSNTKKAADIYLTGEIPSLTYEKYKLFDTTGNRSQYEDNYFGIRCRLTALAFMSIFDNDEKYILKLQDVMWSILNEYTWCLPAHLKGKSLQFDSNDVNAHRRTVDLFAAETGQALSEITYLLKDRLDDIIIKRVQQECYDRVISACYELSPAKNWEKETSNWCSVCAGSVGISAIYTIENNEILARLIQKLYEDMMFYLDGFGDDGACVEGLGYWNYGITYFTSFAELLYQRTNGMINMFNIPKVEKIACFPSLVKLGGGTTANFSDCAPEFIFREGILHKLKDHIPSVIIPSSKYRMKYNGAQHSRWAGFLRDFVWRKNEYRTPLENYETDHLFENAQWYIKNMQSSEHWFSLAVKGGHNNESHNHNDVGHFIYQIDGEALFIDTGADVYTKDYFGSNRYESIFANSAGHSVPIINGKYQSHGSQFRATKFTAENGNATIDISKAYDTDASFVRNIIMERNGNLTVSDSFSANQITERFVCAATDLPIVTDNKIVLKNKSVSAAIIFDDSKTDNISITPLEGDYFEKGIHKYLIDFSLAEKTKDFTININTFK